MSGSSTRPLLVKFVLAAFALCSILASGASEAGGSSESVSIERFETRGVEYTLLVTPAKSTIPDPYMGKCERFGVHGTYRWLRGSLLRQEPGLSRKGHLEALEYLRRAFETKRLGAQFISHIRRELGSEQHRAPSIRERTL